MHRSAGRSSGSARAFVGLVAVAALGGACGAVCARQPAAKPPRVEVLSRGLVHEGFLAPIVYDPAPGLVVTKPAPAPLDEQPPAVKPSGARARWLPGYWAWAPDRSEFIWTSGGWRVPPPDMRWIPGYWAKTSAGFQWTPGFWIAAEASQLAYLPLPPKYKQPPAEENAAAATALPPNRFYVPGYWKWQGRGERGEKERLPDERGKEERGKMPRLQGDFAWQPGYWAQAKPGWVWTPAHYVWTPAGAVCVAGYWDYPLARRGLLFAPASVEPVAGVQGGIRFSPQAVVNLAALPGRLFVSASYGHCCFGDYDTGAEPSLGIELRSAFEARGAGFVPIETAGASSKAPAGEPLVIAITRLMRAKATPLALVELDRAAIRRAALAVEDAREIIGRRRQLETNAAEPTNEAQATGEQTLRLPKLPAELGGAAGGEIATSAADADQLPGIDRRRTPGTIGRSVPGLGGRKVPGVRDPLPGIGELPGADNQR
ncbi:MAG TPA: hypothetical protein VMV10_30340 [Pirellulales bacterium]|nr:hypothetical protein [Pirellulales bacterium]